MSKADLAISEKSPVYRWAIRDDAWLRFKALAEYWGLDPKQLYQQAAGIGLYYLERLAAEKAEVKSQDRGRRYERIGRAG